MLPFPHMPETLSADELRMKKTYTQPAFIPSCRVVAPPVRIHESRLIDISV